MRRVFCIANQKGGVGKTTTAVSLADAFAQSSAKTLLIDFDPQCNTTSGLGLDPIKHSPFILHDEPTVISSENTHVFPSVEENYDTLLSDVLIPTNIPNLDLLPGSRSTADVEVLLRTLPAESARIHELLQQAIEPYDCVFFDCPPSLGYLTQLALFSSTKILIPIQCEFFAMEGFVQQMITVIKKILGQKPDQPNFEEFVGILLTMHDASLELSHLIEKDVRDFFGEITFRTVIPRDVSFSEAQSHGKSIFEYAPRSRGTRAYMELYMEIVTGK